MSRAPSAPGETDRRLDTGAAGMKPRGRREGASSLYFLLTAAVALSLVFGVVRPFVAEVFSIPSESMSPTLKVGDHVLAAKFAYRLGDPERGDLIVFEGTDGPSIKRVVGLPGDKVAVWDGVLFIDGERVREPYVDYGLADSTFFGPERVPKNRLFVMGDNRTNSLDSRSYGPISEDAVMGKVVLRLWPPGRAETF